MTSVTRVSHWREAMFPAPSLVCIQTFPAVSQVSEAGQSSHCRAVWDPLFGRYSARPPAKQGIANFLMLQWAATGLDWLGFCTSNTDWIGLGPAPSGFGLDWLTSNESIRYSASGQRLTWITFLETGRAGHRRKFQHRRWYTPPRIFCLDRVDVIVI